MEIKKCLPGPYQLTAEALNHVITRHLLHQDKFPFNAKTGVTKYFNSYIV